MKNKNDYLQYPITDNDFSLLLDIRRLNMIGCCGHWIGGHQFTDNLFSSLVNPQNLISFKIDSNHIISDNGISLLVNLEELYIHNCSNITNRGLRGLVNLTKLDLYNINSLTDDVFRYLSKIEVLKIHFCKISDTGLGYLHNLRKLDICSCPNISYSSISFLTKLESLSAAYGMISNESLKHMQTIRYIYFYSCRIDGSTLDNLTNVEHLTIFESPVQDRYIDNVLSLDRLKQLCIFRCNSLSKSKKIELKSKLNEILLTDI